MENPFFIIGVFSVLLSLFWVSIPDIFPLLNLKTIAI
jgi:hypothetical protein